MYAIRSYYGSRPRSTPQTGIRRRPQSSSGLRGWVIALLVGVLPTGPVYGMYAMLKELRPKGMSYNFV